MYVSRGNKKVKCNIFNLPCKVTCKPGLKCHEYCYAQKAERMYPEVKPCRMNNLEESKDTFWYRDMLDILKKRKNKIVRIHESGDFYSKDYAWSWYMIALFLPDYTFYAYTKRDDIFDSELLANKPSNFILIRSLDGIRKGKKYHVTRGYDKLAVTHESINNCPANGNKDVVCMVDCKKCISNKKEIIFFKRH